MVQRLCREQLRRLKRKQLREGRRVFHDGVAASLQTRHQTGGLIKPGLKTRLYAL